MRETNLSAVDLNLLPVLEALLRHRNVTRAADDVGLSQPAMSRALSRLRDVLDDPLLVRMRGGYALTPRARMLAPRLSGVLSEVKDLYQVDAFDPARARRTIRLAASDSQTVLLAPPVMARLAREAPGIDLRIEGYGPNIIERMETGAIDLAFAVANTPLPPGAISEPVAGDRLALVMRRRHPAADRAWTLQDYGRFDHVGIALLGDGQSDLDAILAAAGVDRRIALVSPHFMAALATVARTDLVTTVSRAFATRFQATYDLALLEPPFPVAFEMTFVWSRVRASDPLLAWFRALVRHIARTVYAAGAAPSP